MKNSIGETARRWVCRLCSAVAMAAAVSGCSGPMGDEAIAELDEPLFRDSPTWSIYANKRIPVCFTAATQARSDYTIIKNRVIEEIERTWAAVAVLKMDYRDNCPSGARVLISVFDGSGASCGYNTASPSADCNLGATTMKDKSNHHSIAHEFGHALGFTHEWRRADFTVDPLGCASSGNSGSTLNTPRNDVNSMMNSTYCGTATQTGLLSDWDERGIMRLYDSRVPALTALTGGYNATKRDYRLDQHERFFDSQGYAVVPEGWAWDIANIPGTTFMNYYVKGNDILNVASSTGIAVATSKGYTAVGEGWYVYKTKQAGTIALNLYFNSSTGDYMTTTKPVAGDYAFVSTEGYVFQDRPFKRLLQFWTDQGDLVTTADETLLMDHATRYTWTDSAILKYPVQGTTAMNTMLSTQLSDYFTGPFDYAGYAQIATEGYVFTASFPGAVPLYEYWSSSLSDGVITSYASEWEDYKLIARRAYSLPMQR